MPRMPDVRFRPARYDYGARASSDILGLNWHMAESAPGGCVSCYLAGTPQRGVSATFVVEDTGEIVQMLDTLRIPGTVNPDAIRTTDDPDGFYGISTAKAVLGDVWWNPNRHQITVEVAGRAADGPNAKQASSMLLLRTWCFATHPTLRGQTGHRDWTDWKSCPGKRGIFAPPWSLLGGHGLYKPPQPEPEPEMPAVIPMTTMAPAYVTVREGAPLLAAADGLKLERVTSMSRDSRVYSPFQNRKYHAVRASTGATQWDGPELLFVDDADVIPAADGAKREPYCPPSGDADAVKAAIRDTKTKAMEATAAATVAISQIPEVA